MNCSYSNSALRTKYTVLLAPALLVGVPASSASAQEPPEPTVLELSACGERCGLTLVPVVEFGEDAGPEPGYGWFPWVMRAQSIRPASAEGRSDERWADASDNDDQMVYDTVIEVIDWKRGRVIASRRFDEIYSSWIAPRLVGELVITPEAAVRFRMLRVELEAAGN